VDTYLYNNSNTNIVKCPYCKNNKIVKYGKTKNKLQRWQCKSCKKTFIEKTYKGYPPTSYPFEFIALFLYFNGHSSLGKKRRFIKKKYLNNYLKIMNLGFTDIPKQTIHDWIRKYESNYEDIVSTEEALLFFRKNVKKIPVKECPKRELSKIEKLFVIEPRDKNDEPYYINVEIPTHLEILEFLQNRLGKEIMKNIYINRTDEDLYNMYFILNFGSKKQIYDLFQIYINQL
jgi:transposase-like protein